MRFLVAVGALLLPAPLLAGPMLPQPAVQASHSGCITAQQALVEMPIWAWTGDEDYLVMGFLEGGASCEPTIHIPTQGIFEYEKNFDGMGGTRVRLRAEHIPCEQRAQVDIHRRSPFGGLDDTPGALVTLMVKNEARCPGGFGNSSANGAGGLLGISTSGGPIITLPGGPNTPPGGGSPNNPPNGGGGPHQPPINGVEVPEPASIALLGSGLATLVGLRRRKTV